MKGNYGKVPDDLVETNLLKAIRAFKLQCESLVLRLEQNEAADKSSVAHAKTNFQLGFMWAERSITEPGKF